MNWSLLLDSIAGTIVVFGGGFLAFLVFAFFIRWHANQPDERTDVNGQIHTVLQGYSDRRARVHMSNIRNKTPGACKEYLESIDCEESGFRKQIEIDHDGLYRYKK